MLIVQSGPDCQEDQAHLHGPFTQPDRTHDLLKYGSRPLASYRRKSCRLPQDALVHKLLKISLPDYVHLVLGWPRICAKGNH